MKYLSALLTLSHSLSALCNIFSVFINFHRVCFFLFRALMWTYCNPNIEPIYFFFFRITCGKKCSTDDDIKGAQLSLSAAVFSLQPVTCLTNTCTWIKTCILYFYCILCPAQRHRNHLYWKRAFMLFINFLRLYLLIFWLWIHYLITQNMIRVFFEHWKICIWLNVSGKMEMM